MALKRKIDKAAFDALNDVLKAEYKEKDGAYFLDTDDAGELERAIARQKERADKAETDLQSVTAERDELKSNAGDKHKDIQTLETSWKKKLGETEAQYKARVDKLEAHARNTMIDGEALRLASEISTSPKLLLPHIKARLAADLDGDAPTLRILDGTGKVSAASLDDLRQEFIANKDFSSIIVGSKASGGNAGKPGNTSNGNPNANNQNNQPINLAKMSPPELAAHMKAQRESNNA